MSLTGPVIELPPGFAAIRLQYQRWLNVEDAYFDRAEILVNGEQVRDLQELVAENEALRERCDGLERVVFELTVVQKATVSKAD